MRAKRKAGLWRSQLGGIKRLGCSFAQRISHELVQFRSWTRISDDTLPFAVTRLLLKKTGKVHNFTRFVFRQAINYFNQFLGNRSHIRRLPAQGGWGKRDINPRSVSGPNNNLSRNKRRPVFAPGFRDS